LGGVALATFFLAFLTAGLGAGCTATTAGAAGCSAVAVDAGTGAVSGADATAAGAGAGSATAASCGLVAQADIASAEQNKATGREILCILDMVISRDTVDEARFRGNPPIVIRVRQIQILDVAFTQHLHYLINSLCQLQ
jgi:hypothetical protein